MRKMPGANRQVVNSGLVSRVMCNGLFEGASVVLGDKSALKKRIKKAH